MIREEEQEEEPDEEEEEISDKLVSKSVWLRLLSTYLLKLTFKWIEWPTLALKLQWFKGT